MRNYEEGFLWPLRDFNPLGLRSAAELSCTVSFSVLREHFTAVQWYYERVEPAALQHGLRLVVTGSGKVGYFSWEALLTKLLLSVTAFGLAQQLLDVGWYYCYRHSRLIAGKAYHALDIGDGAAAATAGDDGAAPAAADVPVPAAAPAVAPAAAAPRRRPAASPARRPRKGTKDE